MSRSEFLKSKMLEADSSESVPPLEQSPPLVSRFQKLNCIKLSSIETREVHWLWQDRVPQNTLTLIEGDGGRGKSTIIAELCSRWSRGEKLKDDDTVREPMRVLLLAAEDDPAAVLRPRCEAHGADLENVMFDDQSIILNQPGLTALTSAIKEHDIDIVVIDPIVSFLGQKLDMNKGNDVRSVLGPLVKLGRELNCTFIVVRHFNKNSEGSASQRGAGSVDFRNAARSVLQIIHSNGKSYLALEKSNYAAQAKTLSFTVENRKIVWGEACGLTADEIHSENKAGAENKSAIEEAVEFLNAELEGGAMPANEVTRHAKGLGISEKSLRRAKERIGIKSLKLPSGWKWQKQPEEAEKHGQGGQVGQELKQWNLGNVDHVGHLEPTEPTMSLI